ncbi:hypothetical protein AB5J62_14870 [Amycolatopsis sp. cg5]|uniref:DUF7802 domain-containing protein n=1 Tax=Amycolatopsis sp. cg5 TaxID=3238802 RepID=UPI003525AD36
MSAVCGPEAEAVTRGLGFDCHDVSPVLSVRPPWDLAHPTMPLLELLIIGGAIFAFAHALRRHRDGDPVNLALWCTSLVYLFIIEPPLYFPEWFGLERQYGFIFAHNQFTVQFMGDRLPLYIIAFYPVISQLAYELVRSLGIFRRGPAVGAVAVAFVCQVFYEVFDQLGPQLKWWAWNMDNHLVNHPALASVPMNSMLLFASVSMGAMTYLVVRLTSGRSGRSLAPRVLLAGILTPPTMAIAGIPASFFTDKTWVLLAELALVWLAGIWIFVSNRAPAEPSSPFVRVYPAVYLGAMAAFWISSLFTGDGPVGSRPYALTCFLGAGLLTYRASRTAPAALSR